MGLGKTAQSISALECLRRVGGVGRGPFLLVAPLTTLGHWQREVETWTDMYCVAYTGSGADKEVCRAHEFWCVGVLVCGGGGRGRGVWGRGGQRGL